MFDVINREWTTENLSVKFCNADPFNHIIIDNFLDNKFIKNLSLEFPDIEKISWWKYDNLFEKKLAFNSFEKLSSNYKILFSILNSYNFINLLENITKLPGLKADPGLRGGGLHLIKSGGKLDIHEDFNIHPELNLMRRLNVILYMNEFWDDDWGGHLELWDKDVTRCVHKIAPIFNRAVIFRTDQDSNHGHPFPLKTPIDVCRRSIAVYYYTDIPSNISVTPRSTSYKKLPWENDDLDELRRARLKGRLEDKTT